MRPRSAAKGLHSRGMVLRNLGFLPLPETYTRVHGLRIFDHNAGAWKQ